MATTAVGEKQDGRMAHSLFRLWDVKDRRGRLRVDRHYPSCPSLRHTPPQSDLIHPDTQIHTHLLMDSTHTQPGELGRHHSVCKALLSLVYLRVVKVSQVPKHSLSNLSN